MEHFAASRWFSDGHARHDEVQHWRDVVLSGFRCPMMESLFSSSSGPLQLLGRGYIVIHRKTY